MICGTCEITPVLSKQYYLDRWKALQAPPWNCKYIPILSVKLEKIFWSVPNHGKQQRLQHWTVQWEQLLKLEISVRKYTIRTWFDSILEELKLSDSNVEDSDVVCNFLLAMPRKFQTVVSIIESMPPEDVDYNFLTLSTLLGTPRQWLFLHMRFPIATLQIIWQLRFRRLKRNGT